MAEMIKEKDGLVKSSEWVMCEAALLEISQAITSEENRTEAEKPIDQQELQRQLVTQQFTSSEPRITRDNGYGDFYFGSLTTWDKKYHRGSPTHFRAYNSLVPLHLFRVADEDKVKPGDAIRSEKQRLALTKEYLLKYSNAAPIVELDGFVRKSSFPFFRLPKELRDKIYGLLAQNITGFSDYYVEGSEGHIPITISAHELPRQSNLGTFPQFLFHAVGLFQYCEVTGNISRENLQSGESEWIPQYFKEKVAFIAKTSNPPFRSSEYDMQIAGCYGTGDEIESNIMKDWYMLKAIRNYSNVSTRFRLEFAKVFWKNVMFNVTDARAFLNFLKDRPALGFEVKNIIFSPAERPFEEDRGDESVIMTDAMRTDFVELCDYLAKNHELARVHFGFSHTESDLIRLQKGEGRFLYMLALKKLNVSYTKGVSRNKTWSVSMDIIDESDYDADLYSETLSNKWSNILEELLMPDSLRKCSLKSPDNKSKWHNEPASL